MRIQDNLIVNEYFWWETTPVSKFTHVWYMFRCTKLQIYKFSRLLTWISDCYNTSTIEVTIPSMPPLTLVIQIHGYWCMVNRSWREKARATFLGAAAINNATGIIQVCCQYVIWCRRLRNAPCSLQNHANISLNKHQNYPKRSRGGPWLGLRWATARVQILII